MYICINKNNGTVNKKLRSMNAYIQLTFQILHPNPDGFVVRETRIFKMQEVNL